MIVSGWDVLFSEESDKASNVSNKDAAAAAGGTRRGCRRQPPPDGYLYDVSKMYTRIFIVKFSPYCLFCFAFIAPW